MFLLVSPSLCVLTRSVSRSVHLRGPPRLCGAVLGHGGGDMTGTQRTGWGGGGRCVDRQTDRECLLVSF